MKVLNLGCGKIDIKRFESYTSVVHVDRYFNEGCYDSIKYIEENFENPSSSVYPNFICKSDIFEFIDTFKYKFDMVIAERIFEHMEYVGGEVGRLLEGLNAITTDKGIVSIVVPNMVLISKMLLDYENESVNYTHTGSLNTKLIINSETTNCRSDPHLSVWTPVLAKEYIESEGTWKIDNIEERIKFAGRDIYMRITISKT